MNFSFWMVVLTGFIGSNALAENSKKDLEKIANEAMVANGSVSLDTYTPPAPGKKFNYAEADAKLVARFKAYGDGECGSPKKLYGRKKVIQSIGKEADDSPISVALKKLWTQKKILAMTGVEWTGEKGDGEACSIYYYDVYSTDGNVLRLEYELTD